MSLKNKLKLLTSNKAKLNEYNEFGLSFPVNAGLDLPEINTTDYHLIAAHKAKDAGLYNIVEDTILIINGEMYHDIKFRMNEILSNIDKFKNMDIKWIVSLSFMTEENIYVFEGITEGVVGDIYTQKDPSVPIFAFDTFFYVSHNNQLVSLQELKENGLKNNYSARKDAVDLLLAFLNGSTNTYSEIYSNELPKWNGLYQK